jgi:Uncharacterised nucleotidyltransferase
MMAHSGPALRHRRAPGRTLEHGLVHQLLAYAANRPLPPPAGSTVVAARNHADQRQIRQVIEAGLAPLLYRASHECFIEVPAAWRDTLRSADLTAQVRHGNVIDTANEIIDICADMKVPVTLLKGISISDQYYPAAHQRPTGDIDVLVSEASREAVEVALAARGYRHSEHEMDEGSAHGVPLFHDARHVWVDVHNALFPKGSTLRSNKLFSAAQIASQSIASTFHGRPVLRLTNELQLVYIASYWLRDLTDNRIHPSFLPPLFDAVYLLKASGQSLDWEGLLHWLDNEMAMASLYVMLAYIVGSGLDESGSRILPRLASGQNIVGSTELRLILAILDNYLIGDKSLSGRFGHWHRTVLLRTLGTLLTPGPHAAKLIRIPWDIVFPPLAEDRYSFAFHWDRVRRILGGGESKASKE